MLRFSSHLAGSVSEVVVQHALVCGILLPRGAAFAMLRHTNSDTVLSHLWLAAGLVERSL